MSQKGNRRNSGLSKASFTLLGLGILLAGLILAPVFFNTRMSVLDKIACVIGFCAVREDKEVSARSRAKNNLFKIANGIESYPGDHGGKYPPSLSPADFKWEEYMGKGPKNPYHAEITGHLLIEEHMKIEPNPRQAVVAVAQADKRPFKTPGMIRYYIDTHRNHYALTVGLQDLQPLTENNALDRRNFVVHDCDSIGTQVVQHGGNKVPTVCSG